MSTVHVTDVCHALWHLTSHGSSGDVFNLADKSDSSKSFVERVSINFCLICDKQSWSGLQLLLFIALQFCLL